MYLERLREKIFIPRVYPDAVLSVFAFAIHGAWIIADKNLPGSVLLCVFPKVAVATPRASLR